MKNPFLINMKRILFASIIAFGLISCGKDEPAPEETPIVKPYVYQNIEFTKDSAFFATGAGMTEPLDSVDVVDEDLDSLIDIAYIYSTDYSEAGFIDPITRSDHWYWDDYYSPWLSQSKRTLFYSTFLTRTEFESAMKDQSKINSYLNLGTVAVADHAVFPTGTCVGGRPTTDPASLELYKGQVIGFWNYTAGKRGLIFIRPDQVVNWPDNGTMTRVDILREK